MSDSCSWAIRHSQVGEIDGVLTFSAIETCWCAMLEIGFPVAAAMAALCLDPGLRRGEHMELSRELLTAEMIEPEYRRACPHDH